MNLPEILRLACKFESHHIHTRNIKLAFAPGNNLPTHSAWMNPNRKLPVRRICPLHHVADVNVNVFILSKREHLSVSLSANCSALTRTLSAAPLYTLTDCLLFGVSATCAIIGLFAHIYRAFTISTVDLWKFSIETFLAPVCFYRELIARTAGEIFA